MWHRRAAAHHAHVCGAEYSGLPHWLSLEHEGWLPRVLGLSDCQGRWLQHGPELLHACPAHAEKPADDHEARELFARVGADRRPHQLPHRDRQLHNAQCRYPHCRSLLPHVAHQDFSRHAAGPFASLEAHSRGASQWHDLAAATPEHPNPLCRAHGCDPHLHDARHPADGTILLAAWHELPHSPLLRIQPVLACPHVLEADLRPAALACACSTLDLVLLPGPLRARGPSLACEPPGHVSDAAEREAAATRCDRPDL
mmetsp:Transcript_109196/g.152699  ORF Transcript_109196/g.152699 Transcript_109196/m.152699 type:complete len:256 (-) Transcript_109196:1014-1781(-)